MIDQLFMEQAAVRPLSEIQDYVMLAAEQNLGGRKTDLERCRLALDNEMAALPRYTGEEALYERLDGGLCRLNLRPALKRGLTAEGIARIHHDYLTRFQPDVTHFKSDLFILRRMCDRDELPVDGALAAFYLRTLGRVEPGKSRHSATYILNYKPAYRVAFITGVKQLLKEIE